MQILTKSYEMDNKLLTVPLVCWILITVILHHSDGILQKTYFESLYACNSTEIILEFQTLNILQNFTFSNFPQLQRLWLIENDIKEIESESFSNTKLRNLNLANNKIAKFPNLQNLFSLEILNISKNEISSVRCDFLVQLENVLILDLSHNLLVSVPGACNSQIQLSLQELYLNGNPTLMYISEESLAGFANINKIVLVDTNLGQVALDTIVTRLSMYNQPVIKKVRHQPHYSDNEYQVKSEIWANAPQKSNSISFDGQEQPKRSRRKRSTSNNTTYLYDNMTLTEALDKMYKDFQNSFYYIAPTESEYGKYIGYVYIGILSFECLLFMYADIMELIYRVVQNKRQKNKQKNILQKRHSKVLPPGTDQLIPDKSTKILVVSELSDMFMEFHTDIDNEQTLKDNGAKTEEEHSYINNEENIENQDLNDDKKHTIEQQTNATILEKQSNSPNDTMENKASDDDIYLKKNKIRDDDILHTFEQQANANIFKKESNSNPAVMENRTSPDDVDNDQNNYDCDDAVLVPDLQDVVISKEYETTTENEDVDETHSEDYDETQNKESVPTEKKKAINKRKKVTSKKGTIKNKKRPTPFVQPPSTLDSNTKKLIRKIKLLKNRKL